MQDEFNFAHERRRQIQSAQAGCSGPLIAALLVGLVTLTLLYYLLFPRPATAVRLTFRVTGAGQQVSVEYPAEDGRLQFIAVDTPWEATTIFDIVPAEVALRVSGIEAIGQAVGCEIWQDGQRLVAAAATDSTLTCRATLR